MRDYIELRAIEVGKYIIDSKATVRKTATKFGVSKSTVHKDITTRLKRQNAVLYAEGQAALLRNKSERHIRGGNATRDKYREEARKRETAASCASRTQNKTGRPEGKPVPQI